MIKGLTYVILTSEDLPAARRFFVDKLGLGTNDMGDDFSQLGTTDGSGWAVMKAHPEHRPQEIELYLAVDDVDAAFTEWKGRGVTMVTEPHDEDFGRTFAFNGPDARVMHCWKQRG